MGRAMTVILFGGLVLALAGCGGGSSGSGAEATDTAGTTSSRQTVSSEDCRGLGTVVSDLSVGAHANDLVPIALDISASDYVVDRHFLDGYANRVPGDLRADVLRLRDFLDRYASAAQNVGVEPGAVPTPDQVVAIRVASNLGSIEQDKLPGSIQALEVWTTNGCSGGRPPSETTPNPASTVPTTPEAPTNPVAKDSADAAVGDVVDSVTAAVNEVMSRQTERELGSPPVGSEVRNCRKERDFSSNSLLAPGGAAYICEVWFQGKRLSSGGPAAIDVDGNVAMQP
jgi:hypothetical protein